MAKVIRTQFGSRSLRSRGSSKTRRRTFWGSKQELHMVGANGGIGGGRIQKRFTARVERRVYKPQAIRMGLELV